MKPGSPAGKGLALQHMRGFSMVEVLMALLIITFGLLGVAGMQAVSVGNTSTAGYRSIAALEAQSMASAMSANSYYWQSTGVPTATTVIVSSGTITATATGAASSGNNYTATATMNSSSNANTCETSVCSSAASLAQYDVTMWGQALYNSLPGGAGTINCTAATTTVLASCEILITWTEKVLSQNQADATGASATSFNFEMAVVP
jgi:type IV pilus assembly protein PilV